MIAIHLKLTQLFEMKISVMSYQVKTNVYSVQISAFACFSPRLFLSEEGYNRCWF
jgi:hypothetical protein